MAKINRGDRAREAKEATRGSQPQKYKPQDSYDEADNVGDKRPETRHLVVDLLPSEYAALKFTVAMSGKTMKLWMQEMLDKFLKEEEERECT